jgi:creatinine amidohydrolase/Fe(II)-dependent formamide hydrolase-like protein
MPERDTVLLEELTWPEVESVLDEGTRTAVAAVGSVEQHGPHLPLVVDTLAGDELSRRIAESWATPWRHRPSGPAVRAIIWTSLERSRSRQRR